MKTRLFVLVASALVSACEGGQGSTTARPGDLAGNPQDQIEVTGTIQWFSFEGGFWAIRASDGQVYDPSSPLEAVWQKPDLSVRAVLRIRPDLVSVHMVGTIVDVLRIGQF
jgi:hypothetical protein